MMRIVIILLAFAMFACNLSSENKSAGKTGSFEGVVRHGNFFDTIQIRIEQDSAKLNVYFSSLAQNANQIPMQNVVVIGDSINFELRSDFYTYFFKNKWVENSNKLQGCLLVDTVTVPYTLHKDFKRDHQIPESEDVKFESNGSILNGTIWHPTNKGNKALVILTSSGNADRSASRAEAILFSKMGFTTFHYDKRGTGRSEGNWEAATIEELSSDDINAIRYFSDKTGIPINQIGIKGSSQGAAKVPYILGELRDLKYGIAVSCPGVSLLESDLNYWINRNAEAIGSEIDKAAVLQRMVFEYVAGDWSRQDVEKAINNAKSEPWFDKIWVPDLDEVQIDKKLHYSPILYFGTTRQPILILQGTMDEIIPASSHQLIANALTKANNKEFAIVLLKGASHSMSYIGETDFPYWSKLHPDYLTTIADWIDTVNGNTYIK